MTHTPTTAQVEHSRTTPHLGWPYNSDMPWYCQAMRNCEQLQFCQDVPNSAFHSSGQGPACCTALCQVNATQKEGPADNRTTLTDLQVCSDWAGHSLPGLHKILYPVLQTVTQIWNAQGSLCILRSILHDWANLCGYLLQPRLQAITLHRLDECCGVLAVQRRWPAIVLHSQHTLIRHHEGIQGGSLRC